MSIVYKTFVQIYNERVVNHGQEALFDLNVINLFKFYYLSLLQGLHCDDIFLNLCKIHFSESARTDHL